MNEPPLGKTEACMVDINFMNSMERSSLLLEINIVECSLDMICVPLGDIGLSAMLGYVL